jgi:glycosyltransferase involved in cell wall biosynthesis
MVAPFSVYPKGTVTVRMLPIAKSMKKWGDDVTIVVPPYDNLFESGRKYVLENIQIFNVVFRDLPLIKYPLVLFSLCRIIFSLRPNCIYIFKPKGYSGLVAMFFILLRSIGLWRNLVLLLDTDDWEGRGGFYDLFRKHSNYSKIMLDFIDFQETWIPPHVDAVTIASRTLFRRLLKQGVPSSKAFYIPNGASRRDFRVDSRDTELLKKSLRLENHPVILLYTRFFEYDIKKVIKIFELVLNELKSVKLLIVGKGEFGEEAQLKQLAFDKGFSDSVIFAGWIQAKDIPKYLSLGEVAIYPLKDTPLNRSKCPGKLIELMLAGKAIVADKVGQVSEYIVHGSSGFLVSNDDVEHFASGVVAVLKNKKLAYKLGTNARTRATTVFNWDRITYDFQKAISSRISREAN